MLIKCIFVDFFNMNNKQKVRKERKNYFNNLLINNK